MCFFTLWNRNSDPDPDTDICPKNGYSNDQGSRSGLKSMQWEKFLYSTMQPSGLNSEFESVSESVSAMLIGHYGLFTLPDSDTDSNSDWTYKPNGYILPCRTFHTARSPTAEYRHGNGIGSESESGSVNVNRSLMR